MPIYTRTGDGGETSLNDGSRVPKNDIRVAAYGTVDELSSVLGLLRCEHLDRRTGTELARIQEDLFEIGTDLATPGGRRTEAILARRVRDLEEWIDDIMRALPPLRAFVLPAGARPAALCHMARTVCRRAERAGWAARESHDFPPVIVVYLNRLSDLLFALARHENDRAGVADVEWRPRPDDSGGSP